MAPEIVPFQEIPFEDVEAFDRKHFLWPRRDFLKKWIQPVGGAALGFHSSGKLRGYRVLRPCQSGFKIGPLFAETPAIAGTLFQALSSKATGQPLFLDIPENNPEAVALASTHGLKEVFGCARMVLGPVPPIPWNSIYGITTFELG